MRFSFWLRKWQRSAPAASRRTRTSPRQQASFRPRLEALEDRVVPSHGHGGSPGSGSGGGLPYATAGTVPQLIADINYANTAGGTITINLKPGTTFDLTRVNNTTTTNGANGLPVIGGTKAVTLTINGKDDTIERTGSNYFRLLEVAKGASLILDHVTLQGGYARNSVGGAIDNLGTLNVSNSTLSGNISTRTDSYLSGGAGGAIYNENGKATVSNCTLSGNSADLGGGIYNLTGTLTISSSTLTGNSGSGVFLYAGTVSVSTCTLTDNYGSGGIYNTLGTLTVKNSDFANNSPDNIDGMYIDGGGNKGLP